MKSYELLYELKNKNKTKNNRKIGRKKVFRRYRICKKKQERALKTEVFSMFFVFHS